MKLSMNAAAKRAGVGKATIHRAIKSGRLSAERDGVTFLIDPAELARVFPPAPRSAGPVAEPTTDQPDPPVSPLWTALLDVERRRADAAERDRDAWREQAQRLALAAPIATPAMAPATSRPKQGLFAGWFGPARA